MKKLFLINKIEFLRENMQKLFIEEIDVRK
jgi:hypothetical protein